MSVKITGIIPARYGSTRLPGKALLPVNGKPMIVNVYERAIQSKSLNDLWVATDDARIFKEIEVIGGNVMMTSTNHPSGTDRCAEVARKLQTEFVINIQGDEPLIHPNQIDELASICNRNVEIATLIKKIDNPADLSNDSVVKVVKNLNDFALYFSRNPIPYFREDPVLPNRIKRVQYWKHIGIYAYKKETLLELCNLAESNLEQSEKLEQLRWLENGFDIKLVETRFDSISVDTSEDYEILLNQLHYEKI